MLDLDRVYRAIADLAYIHNEGVTDEEDARRIRVVMGMLDEFLDED